MRVEMWSDVVCPWCYIGSANLESALAGFDANVEVVHRSFLLDPSAPEVPISAVDHLAHKYGGGREQALQMMQQVGQVAARAGLECNLENSLTGRTFDAHRLLHLAAEERRQKELSRNLFTAHFVHNRSIFDDDSLRKLAVESGLDAGEVTDVLRSDRFADAVAADIEQAQHYGITGVPFFVIDGRYGVSGAQPPDVLRQALEQAAIAA